MFVEFVISPMLLPLVVGRMLINLRTCSAYRCGHRILSVALFWNHLDRICCLCRRCVCVCANVKPGESFYEYLVQKFFALNTQQV